jgi:glucan-binding YG repeat protein
MLLFETTEWSDNIPNHVYIANNTKDRIEGYFNVVKNELVWFSKPQRFDRRGRTFKSFDFIITEEDNMTDFAFTAVMNAINNLPKNTDYNKILKNDYGFEKVYPKQQAKFICQYILQGSAKGLTGDELVKYALKSQADLFDRFPHLQEDNPPVESEDNTVAVKTTKTKAKSTKTVAKTNTKKAAKQNPNSPVITTRKITTKKVTPKYENGTVYFREDRNKWIAIWNNIAEAARPTKEGAINFLKKKYNAEAIILE